MKKFLLTFLWAGALLYLSGCRNAPSAAPNLAVFSPVPTESCCLLSYGKNTFKLHPDRQYALFNATPVQLPAPAAYGKEKCYRVTPGTLKNIITPLMTGKVPARKIRRILIDPGHGGHDTGAPGAASREKELNLLLAAEIRAALNKAGFQTVMTRDRDVFLPLRDRVKLVKKYKADLFVSVHHNSSKTRPDASGIECFAYRSPRPEDTLLAASIQQALVRTTGCVDRGVKFARLAVLRENPAPAVLIEAGFISNQTDEKFLNDPKWRRSAARAAAEGVVRFVRLAGE